jgi:hypothetical protein
MKEYIMSDPKVVANFDFIPEGYTPPDEAGLFKAPYLGISQISSKVHKEHQIDNGVFYVNPPFRNLGPTVIVYVLWYGLFWTEYVGTQTIDVTAPMGMEVDKTKFPWKRLSTENNVQPVCVYFLLLKEHLDLNLVCYTVRGTSMGGARDFNVLLRDQKTFADNPLPPFAYAYELRVGQARSNANGEWWPLAGGIKQEPITKEFYKSVIEPMQVASLATQYDPRLLIGSDKTTEQTVEDVPEDKIPF